MLSLIVKMKGCVCGLQKDQKLNKHGQASLIKWCVFILLFSSVEIERQTYFTNNLTQNQQLFSI